MPDFREEAQTLRDQLIAWRRDLHRHPELAFEERRTAGLVAEHLKSLGLDVRTGVGKTGVIGLLEGARPGKTVMLRFDMDALPVEEANEVEYASQIPGRMHACGHDGHTAIGLGVATLLARHRSVLHGRVKFVFQPAEEAIGGARAVIDDGALEDPTPDVAFGLHLWNALPLGQAIVQAGPLMAAATHFQLIVQGRGGHGARPHETRDPLVAAAHFVTAVQTVVSRNIEPSQKVVLSVGTFHAGHAFNVIPDRAELGGTIRTLDDGVLARVEQRLQEIIEGIARAFDVRTELQIRHAAPVLINDERAAAYVARAARRVLGDGAVRSMEPLMVSEDMSEFLNRVPGCYFLMGSMNPDRGLDYPHHHPRFDFDEDALPLGVAILAEATVIYLSEEVG
ncbi:MAG TPA: amidohydrolase [Caldilineae bacterium]|nr:amidohydrolase [Caldilineae bacterium]